MPARVNIERNRTRHWNACLWEKLYSFELLYPFLYASKKVKEFRCYEAKIEESEKAGSCRESNPGHL